MEAPGFVERHEKDPDGNIRSLLAARGLRYSRPRAVILSYFREEPKHINAETLHHSLRSRGNNLSLSTVYLNLSVLKDAGLVREFRGLAGELLYDSNAALHGHLICKHCARVIDLPEEVSAGETQQQLKQRVETVSGWEVEAPSLNLYGLCPSCR